MKTKRASKQWTHTQLGKNVFRVETELIRNRDWEFWTLLTSDQHWDNKHSNRQMQLRHLKQAKERNAAIMSAGDYFCLMQGKFDKRSNKDSLRPEHRTDNYFDTVVATAADFLEPYAKQFVVIATGNHEQAVSDKHEINIIDRFVGVLNNRTGSKISNGGYSGYIIFRFRRQAAKSKPSNVIVLRYEHGAGGSNPMSGSRGVHYPDADIVLSGHNHTQWLNELGRQRIDKHTGALKQDVQTHLKCPSYKDEFGDGYEGWATATKGLPPKPIGAWWIRFYYEKATDRVLYEITQAK